jgi:hypothetical protein
MLRWSLCGLLLCIGGNVLANPPGVSTRTTHASEFVRDALAAASTGNTTERDELLRQAIRLVPNSAPAHWALGQVQLANKWLTIEDAERANSKNSVVAQYRDLSDQQSGSAEGERYLAEWCRKHGLEEEALLHWRQILKYDPENAEALSRSRMQHYNGVLLTSAEVAKQKETLHRTNLTTARWQPSLMTWRRYLKTSDERLREIAVTGMQGIKDVDAIPVLESLQTSNSSDDLSCAFAVETVHTLARMGQRVAAEALVRQAAASDWPEARQAAKLALSQRELLDYVPYALGSLHGPIQRTAAVTIADNGNIIYRQEISCERAEANEHRILVKETRPNHTIFRAIKQMRDGRDTSNDFLYHQQLALNLAQRQAEIDYQATCAENQAAEIRNKNICALLRANVGVDKGEDLNAWWDWWRLYNEYIIPDCKPTQTQTCFNYNPGISCFAAGTQVSTLVGLEPIESIRPGDRVLSKDPVSGELAYKLVLATTVRPPSPIRDIRVGDETIQSTRGHRFWQEGTGWRMAKYLEPEARLHSVRAPVTIESIADVDDQQAYNLVVADFHTYFVGKQRLLVHDNSLPRQVKGPTPGLVETPSTAK